MMKCIVVAFAVIAVFAVNAKNGEDNRLQWYLEKNGIIIKLQAGFRARHCTMDQVIRLETAARRAINEGKILAAVFLDINKAYDET